MMYACLATAMAKGSPVLVSNGMNSSWAGVMGACVEWKGLECECTSFSSFRRSMRNMYGSFTEGTLCVVSSCSKKLMNKQPVCEHDGWGTGHDEPFCDDPCYFVACVLEGTSFQVGTIPVWRTQDSPPHAEGHTVKSERIHNHYRDDRPFLCHSFLGEWQLPN